MGTKLLRVSHTPVKKLADLPLTATSRRIWIQTANPSRPERALSAVPARSSICGMTFAPPAMVFALLSWPRHCHAKPLLMHALTLLVLAWVATCACLIGANVAFKPRWNPATLAANFAWFPANANPQQYIAYWPPDCAVVVSAGLSRDGPPPGPLHFPH